MGAGDRFEGGKGTLAGVLYAGSPKLELESEWTSLVQAIVAGDQNALHALYERTHRIVFTLAIRITADRETAEEVTVDVYHEVWRRAASYDPEQGTVIAWIMNQARSRTIDRIRRDQRAKRVQSSEIVFAGSGTEFIDPRRFLEMQERAAMLRNALLGLTMQERESIQTAYFSGLTYEETAERLDQPVGTVKTRIRSGLAKLRHALRGSREE